MTYTREQIDWLQLIKLESREQFDKLKQGDILAIRWKPRSVVYKQGKEIDVYRVHEVLKSADEILLRKRDNLYFNIGMYLNGESTAAEVALLAVMGLQEDKT